MSATLSESDITREFDDEADPLAVTMDGDATDGDGDGADPGSEGDGDGADPGDSDGGDA